MKQEEVNSNLELMIAYVYETLGDKKALRVLEAAINRYELQGFNIEEYRKITEEIKQHYK